MKGASPALLLYMWGSYQLAILDQAGELESSEADVVRDAIDSHWRSMNNEEQREARRHAAMLMVNHVALVASHAGNELRRFSFMCNRDEMGQLFRILNFGIFPSQITLVIEDEHKDGQSEETKTV